MIEMTSGCSWKFVVSRFTSRYIFSQLLSETRIFCAMKKPHTYSYLNEEMLDISFWVNICSAKTKCFLSFSSFHLTQNEVHQHREREQNFYVCLRKYFSFNLIFIYLSNSFAKLFYAKSWFDFHLSVKLWFQDEQNLLKEIFFISRFETKKSFDLFLLINIDLQ